MVQILGSIGPRSHTEIPTKTISFSRSQDTDLPVDTETHPNSSLTFTLHRVAGKPGLNCLFGHYTPDIKAIGHVSNIPFTYIIPFSLILSSLLICSTCTSSPRTRISDTLFPSSDKTIFTLISSFLDAFVQ